MPIVKCIHCEEVSEMQLDWGVLNYVVICPYCNKKFGVEFKEERKVKK